MIDVAEDIHPLSEFTRRTTEFVRRLRENRRPMLLTLKGRPEMVVLDARSYQNLIDEIREYRNQFGPMKENGQPAGFREELGRSNRA